MSSKDQGTVMIFFALVVNKPKPNCVILPQAGNITKLRKRETEATNCTVWHRLFDHLMNWTAMKVGSCQIVIFYVALKRLQRETTGGGGPSSIKTVTTD
jgi:hypothetical protein